MASNQYVCVTFVSDTFVQKTFKIHSIVGPASDRAKIQVPKTHLASSSFMNEVK